MTRHSVAFTTPVAGASVELAANTNILNLVGAPSVALKLRRLIVGVVRVDSSTPVSLQVELGIYAASVRGTATATAVPAPLLIGGSASTSPGIDTAWSAAPTIAARPLLRVAFNETATYDYTDESLTPITIPAGSANGLVLRNLRAIRYYQHAFVITACFDE